MAAVAVARRSPVAVPAVPAVAAAPHVVSMNSVAIESSVVAVANGELTGILH